MHRPSCSMAADMLIPPTVRCSAAPPALTTCAMIVVRGHTVAGSSSLWHLLWPSQVAKGVGDKLYEKRKRVALEVEQVDHLEMHL